MHTGIQIIAPRGFAPLEKNIVYYFLKSDAKRNRVLLARFDNPFARTDRATVTIVQLDRGTFESAVEGGQIVPRGHQSTMPPWLEPFTDADLELIETKRLHGRRPYRETIERRELIVLPHANELEHILAADDPNLEMNRRARGSAPRQNERRFRLWLVAYICFGMTKWALMPPLHRIGKWPRREHPGVKFGAPNRAYGRQHGFAMTDALEQACIEGYDKFCGPGKYMTRVYAESMKSKFGCRTTAGRFGGLTLYHPEGKPFPSFWQFKYQVIKKHGLLAVQTTLFGEARVRRRMAGSKGSFAQEVANLHEEIEADGYYTDELPRGFIDGSTLEPLCVVTSSDVLSGMKLGIGFAYPAERSQAYRLMLFSMAVPKVFFCSLFGLRISEKDWPSHGLPACFSTDRGPGASDSLFAQLERRIPIRDLTPAYSGQSKATVETSNPKSLKREGCPLHTVSNLSLVELARKEIVRLIHYNHATNVEHRFDPQPELRHVLPTPAALYEYYDSRFRNDGRSMSIPDAVRTFLTPVRLSVDKSFVRLGQRRYSSSALRKSGLFDRIARNGGRQIEVPGYMLDLSLRYIWAEIDGKLFQLEAHLSVRSDGRELWLAYSDLKKWETERDLVASAMAQHQPAVSVHCDEIFEQGTGKSRHGGTMRRGRPKRSQTTQQEGREAAKVTQARRH